MPPVAWQKYVIDIQAPKFDKDGKKVANAKLLKVELNGTVIQKDVEMKGPTPAGMTGKEAAEGPVMFQGDHAAVAFRNLKVTPMEFGK
ncbi:MAG TPA: family 16 glycoside hydrolase [Roseibacillus sp.]|nr:family 16 glycoside hydrolase [Roseibacillus sp.]